MRYTGFLGSSLPLDERPNPAYYFDPAESLRESLVDLVVDSYTDYRSDGTIPTVSTLVAEYA